MKLYAALLGLLSMCSIVRSQNTNFTNPASIPSLQWITFPDSRLSVSGLPWFEQNVPDLWRLPKSVRDTVPKGVWNRAVAPDGGRIRFSATTACLAIRVQARTALGKRCCFDVFTNDHLAGSAQIIGTAEQVLTLFTNQPANRRDITIYLPNNHEVRLEAVGLDAGAKLQSPPPFSQPKPLVCYGSSVLQGTGAGHPSQTYPAILARRLNLDFVNLGFGGAGKAETNVVALVNSIDACCYLLDLGKSYGDQSSEAYERMVDALREKHPRTPIICVTPIYATRESTDPAYKEKSEKLRAMTRRTAADRAAAGDKLISSVEGLDLFGPDDKAFFHDPLHPNDEGNERLAARLVPSVGKTLASAFGAAQ